ncbi:hypothetical protein HAT2_00750 [Candidatus Similichlamydia laticola]|uniref:Uncharacterized protein n=1 Tax=Candidatus Similichlamydia laticola TaxID=2170265 RepID=A0A369KB58_9BACT|nr:hypothetical protein HAT2_00750 [Candidatus Similichlamydia laticola]
MAEKAGPIGRHRKNISDMNYPCSVEYAIHPDKEYRFVQSALRVCGSGL